MILFLYGKDSFRSRAHLHKMMDKFRADRDPQGFNTVRVDCLSAPEMLMEQVSAAPFLAERRMVVVEQLLASKQTALQKDILARVENQTVPETTVCVFWEGNDVFKTKDAKALFARLQKEKYAQAFHLLKGVQLGGWIAAEVKERGGSIENQAVHYLTSHIGEDMWHLSSLLEQLIAYKQDDEIKIVDIQLFLDESADDNIFNLVDAIVAKQSKQAYAMIQQQYSIGEDVQFIFAMVLRQFRILLEIRDLFEREDAMPSNIVANKLNLHPFVVKKSLPLVKRYTRGQLEDVYTHLLTLDQQIKKGAASQEALLDIFVSKVTSA